ncbi:30S ribosomal protein S26e [Nanobdella aerobiophila]|uniref:30S ribosomal protein S26e n=1 Tax=Nanobdella aerobiophila TaxID=2586965 RepID=A0A915SSM7_9ARCH|nr:hypothetical protein [Nanobdella aerobiophila]BBL45501.1 30S ribosomal protein S26e [Nanobdella aerobiophila]
MKDKKYQYTSCYYCGKMTRMDKAIKLSISARLKPDITGDQAPSMIISSPMKIYICPACARYRGISKKDIRNKNKEQEILKKLGIEV